MNPLIYVVEDDPNIQNVIKIALENSQFNVACFEHAKSMFQELEIKQPNLFVLDIMLPDMDGLTIIKKLKKFPQYKDIPILIVSAKSSELDKVIGLDIGADDYLIKPFGILELISRVKALLRRTFVDKTEQFITIKELELDTKTHQVSFQEETMTLTNKQFELLKYLMLHQGDILSRKELMNAVWGYEFIGESRTLDVHMNELRKKLALLTKRKDIIDTIHGIGFKLEL